MIGHQYTDEQLEMLKTHRPTTTIKQLTESFNQRFNTNITAEAIHQVCLRKGYKSNHDGRFQKGIIVWNKGTKGVIKKNSGSFKKGHMPPSFSEVGTEMIDKTDGHIYVKIANPDQWIQKHRLNWIKAHGEIPPNHVVIFTDGNKLNTDLNNLELISRSELLALNRNHYSSTPDELKPIVKIMAKLEASVTKQKSRLGITRATNLKQKVEL